MTTTKPRPKTATGVKQKIEEKIADRIIDLLDEGKLPPWEKQWHDSPMGNPMNAVSMKPYRGVNHWLTLLTQDVMDYTDPRWMTFRQAQGLGGTIMKGEKGTQVIFWKPIVRAADAAGPDGTVQAGPGQNDPDGKTRSFPMLRAYTIFNVDQTQGCVLKDLPEPPVGSGTPIERAEVILAGMPDPPEIANYEHDNQAPHYIPARDIVRVPSMTRYRDPEYYYNTMFHELTHATGHPKRLNRFVLEAGGGLHAYGQEELVAGMGAAMLGGHAGIGTRVLELDASYIQNWRDTIKGDKAMVLRAASLAQRAVDFILDEAARQEQAENEAEPNPTSA